MNRHFARRRFEGDRLGFSMVELLAVIGIISVMAVLIGIGLKGGNETVSVKNGQRIAASIFQSARSIAVLKQTPTRVLIYAEQSGDDTDPRKYLRYMGVVYLKEGGDANKAADWEPANQGTYLPDGVFFAPGDASGDLSATASASTPGIVDATTGNEKVLGSKLIKNNSKVSLKYPVNVAAAPNENWYYYQFDANGMFENPGETFVLVAGRYDLETPPHVAVENALSSVGLAIRRMGGTILINDYDEIAQINKN